jgi:hypothetical protein
VAAPGSISPSSAKRQTPSLEVIQRGRLFAFLANCVGLRGRMPDSPPGLLLRINCQSYAALALTSVDCKNSLICRGLNSNFLPTL